MNAQTKRTASSRLEKLAFAITRLLALVSVAGVLICIALLAVRLIAALNSGTVTIDQVVKEAKASKPDSSDDSTATAKKTDEVSVPADLAVIFNGDNEKVLHGWLKILSEEDQREFLANMQAVVKEAKARNLNVVESVNAYKTIKMRKLGASGFDKYADAAPVVGFLAGIFALLLILGVLSLVLVLLAIERNTRPHATGTSDAT